MAESKQAMEQARMAVIRGRRNVPEFEQTDDINIPLRNVRENDNERRIRVKETRDALREIAKTPSQYSWEGDGASSLNQILRSNLGNKDIRNLVDEIREQTSLSEYIYLGDARIPLFDDSLSESQKRHAVAMQALKLLKEIQITDGTDEIETWGSYATGELDRLAQNYRLKGAKEFPGTSGLILSLIIKLKGRYIKWLSEQGRKKEPSTVIDITDDEGLVELIDENAETPLPTRTLNIGYSRISFMPQARYTFHLIDIPGAQAEQIKKATGQTNRHLDKILAAAKKQRPVLDEENRAILDEIEYSYQGKAEVTDKINELKKLLLRKEDIIENIPKVSIPSGAKPIETPGASRAENKKFIDLLDAVLLPEAAEAQAESEPHDEHDALLDELDLERHKMGEVLAKEARKRNHRGALKEIEKRSTQRLADETAAAQQERARKRVPGLMLSKTKDKLAQWKRNKPVVQIAGTSYAFNLPQSEADPRFSELEQQALDHLQAMWQATAKDDDIYIAPDDWKKMRSISNAFGFMSNVYTNVGRLASKFKRLETPSAPKAGSRRSAPKAISIPPVTGKLETKSNNAIFIELGEGNLYQMEFPLQGDDAKELARKRRKNTANLKVLRRRSAELQDPEESKRRLGAIAWKLNKVYENYPDDPEITSFIDEILENVRKPMQRAKRKADMVQIPLDEKGAYLPLFKAAKYDAQETRKRREINVNKLKELSDRLAQVNATEDTQRMIGRVSRPLKIVRDSFKKDPEITALIKTILEKLEKPKRLAERKTAAIQLKLGRSEPVMMLFKPDDSDRAERQKRKDINLKTLDSLLPEKWQTKKSIPKPYYSLVRNALKELGAEWWGDLETVKKIADVNENIKEGGAEGAPQNTLLIELDDQHLYYFDLPMPGDDEAEIAKKRGENLHDLLAMSDYLSGLEDMSEKANLITPIIGQLKTVKQAFRDEADIVRLIVDIDKQRLEAEMSVQRQSRLARSRNILAPLQLNEDFGVINLRLPDENNEEITKKRLRFNLKRLKEVTPADDEPDILLHKSLYRQALNVLLQLYRAWAGHNEMLEALEKLMARLSLTESTNVDSAAPPPPPPDALSTPGKTEPKPVEAGGNEQAPVNQDESGDDAGETNPLQRDTLVDTTTVDPTAVTADDTNTNNPDRQGIRASEENILDPSQRITLVDTTAPSEAEQATGTDNESSDQTPGQEAAAGEGVPPDQRITVQVGGASATDKKKPAATPGIKTKRDTFVRRTTFNLPESQKQGGDTPALSPLTPTQRPTGAFPFVDTRNKTTATTTTAAAGSAAPRPTEDTAIGFPPTPPAGRLKPTMPDITRGLTSPAPEDSTFVGLAPPPPKPEIMAPVIGHGVMNSGDFIDEPTTKVGPPTPPAVSSPAPSAIAEEPKAPAAARPANRTIETAVVPPPPLASAEVAVAPELSTAEAPGSTIEDDDTIPLVTPQAESVDSGAGQAPASRRRSGHQTFRGVPVATASTDVDDAGDDSRQIRLATNISVTQKKGRGPRPASGTKKPDPTTPGTLGPINTANEALATLAPVHDAPSVMEPDPRALESDTATLPPASIKVGRSAGRRAGPSVKRAVAPPTPAQKELAMVGNPSARPVLDMVALEKRKEILTELLRRLNIDEPADINNNDLRGRVIERLRAIAKTDSTEAKRILTQMRSIYTGQGKADDPERNAELNEIEQELNQNMDAKDWTKFALADTMAPTTPKPKTAKTAIRVNAETGPAETGPSKPNQQQLAQALAENIDLKNDDLKTLQRKITEIAAFDKAIAIRTIASVTGRSGDIRKALEENKAWGNDYEALVRLHGERKSDQKVLMKKATQANAVWQAESSINQMLEDDLRGAESALKAARQHFPEKEDHKWAPLEARLKRRINTQSEALESSIMNAAPETPEQALEGLKNAQDQFPEQADRWRAVKIAILAVAEERIMGKAEAAQYEDARAMLEKLRPALDDTEWAKQMSQKIEEEERLIPIDEEEEASPSIQAPPEFGSLDPGDSMRMVMDPLGAAKEAMAQYVKMLEDGGDEERVLAASLKDLLERTSQAQDGKVSNGEKEEDEKNTGQNTKKNGIVSDRPEVKSASEGGDVAEKARKNTERSTDVGSAAKAKDVVNKIISLTKSRGKRAS